MLPGAQAEVQQVTRITTWLTQEHFACHKSAVLTLINGLVPPSICDVINFLQRDM